MLVQEKVPGGKLLCVEVSLEGGRIAGIRITGDFFLHPEEAIADIEKCLIGAKPEDAAGIVARALAQDNAQLIGASPDDIGRLVMKAVS